MAVNFNKGVRLPVRDLHRIIGLRGLVNINHVITRDYAAAPQFLSEKMSEVGAVFVGNSITP